MSILLESVRSDIHRLGRRRAVNALASLLVTTAQILFSASLLYFTVTEDIRWCGITAMLSTFTITLDQTLRVRENAAEDHQRLLMLKGLEEDLLHPERGDDPYWQEYKSIHEQEDISYVHASMELCFPPK